MANSPHRQLTLLDTTSIIVGIVIGSTIFQSSPTIARSLPHTSWLIAAWIAGGLISLCGALCYAELGTAYPQNGGDYVYLTRAYGRPFGFMFAWAQLWVVRPGSIGAMAFVFASYANQLYSLGEGPKAKLIYAISAVTILALINLLGVRQGKWTQNLLTLTKITGLSAIVVVGMFFPSPGAISEAPAIDPDVSLALILILFAYSGWAEMPCVAAEVRNPERNIVRALALGTVVVAVIYLAVNLAFFHSLGFGGFADSKAVAADVMRAGMGDLGGRAISLLICISALGSINGLTFTGARVTYAMGREHRFYAWLGRWSARHDTPVWSLVLQTVVSLALVIGFGQTDGGFERLVVFTTPVSWSFFLLVGAGLIVLRYRDRITARPYRVLWYPLTPIVFCAASSFMLYYGINYASMMWNNSIYWSAGILVLGIILSVVDVLTRRNEPVLQVVEESHIGE